MADLDWSNPNSLKLVIQIKTIKDDLEMDKDYFAIVSEMEINNTKTRRINILTQNSFIQN